MAKKSGMDSATLNHFLQYRAPHTSAGFDILQVVFLVV
jgi:hypothetical protein